MILFYKALQSVEIVGYSQRLLFVGSSGRRNRDAHGNSIGVDTMKPVFISPSFEQTKELEGVLRQAGIAVSVVEKKNHMMAEADARSHCCELWLKHPSDIDRANSIITQYEFNSIKQLLSRPLSPIHPPVANAVLANKEDLRKAMEQAHLPINNQRVFKRLAKLLGFSEKEAEQADVNKLYRPWNNKSLMERVKILQEMCISTTRTPPDSKRH